MKHTGTGYLRPHGSAAATQGERKQDIGPQGNLKTLY